MCVSETGGQRKRFDLEPSYAVYISGYLVVEARKRDSLWAPAMVQATCKNNSLREDCAKNQATLDTYIS